MAKYIMALDAGTTSNRCILFNEHGEICSVSQKILLITISVPWKRPDRCSTRTVLCTIPS